LETPALVRHNHAQGHSVGTSSPREVHKLLHQSIFSTTKHPKCALKNNSAFQNVHFSQMKITGKVEEIESDLHDQLKVSFVLLVSLAMHSFFRYNLQRW